MKVETKKKLQQSLESLERAIDFMDLAIEIEGETKESWMLGHIKKQLEQAKEASQLQILSQE